MSNFQLNSNSPIPIYYQIYSTIMAMIENGDYRPGQALPSERQYAELFGVARPTVAKALDLLQREGFISKQQGRGNIVLSKDAQTGQDVGTIAFVTLSHITHDLVMGMSQMVLKHDFHLQILGVDYQFNRLENYLDTCLQSGVKGFIIYGRPNSKDAVIYKDLLERNIPIVLVDRYYKELDCDHVVYNNEVASYHLTQSLIKRGHNTIAAIPGYEISVSSVQQRLKGYRRAIEEAGLRYDEELVWLDLYNSVMSRQQVQGGYATKLLDKLEKYRPTALLTINDTIANFTIYDLMQMEYALASSEQSTPIESYFDIEIASFGAEASINHNSLKVLAVQPTYEMGQRAASLLIDRLKTTFKTKYRKPIYHRLDMNIVEYPHSTKSLVSKEESFLKRNTD